MSASCSLMSSLYVQPVNYSRHSLLIFSKLTEKLNYPGYYFGPVISLFFPQVDKQIRTQMLPNEKLINNNHNKSGCC